MAHYRHLPVAPIKPFSRRNELRSSPFRRGHSSRVQWPTAVAKPFSGIWKAARDVLVPGLFLQHEGEGCFTGHIGGIADEGIRREVSTTARGGAR
jgi:hypothetical protein